MKAFLGQGLEPEAILAGLARVPVRPWWGNALTGLAFASAGLAVRWAASSFYGDITGFIILLPAVILAALTGGRMAGGVAAVACLLGGWAITGPDAVGAGITTALGRVATVNFILVSLFCTLVAASLRKTVARLDGSITDLERSRVRVDETETRLHDIADIAPIMLWTTAAEGPMYANAAFRLFWGDRSLSGLDPAPWIDAIHPDDRDRIAAAGLGAWTSRSRLEIEGRYRRADGAWRTLATIAEPRQDPQGRFLGMIGANADVTEARSAERALKDSEARFRAIADTAPVLIWVANEDHSRAFVNQAYVDFMGGDYESVRTADWHAGVHPEDQAQLVSESVAGEASGQPFSLEARYRHHNGDYRWLRSFSRPRLSPGGTIIGFVGVAFDVTDARRVEHDLKRINELLEERVGEALAEKARAEADLMHAQRMEAVGRLTGGVAHDFNNLLTVVMGALELILKAPDDAARRQKLGEAALSAARRGERLTHQLLAFSRRQALRPESIDINALIRESDPLLRRAVGEAVSYRLKLRRGGARVIVDPAQFEAALLNLIVNARDAIADRSPDKGAAVTVRTEACRVAAGEVVDLTPGDYVCVTVEDTGVGMDEEIVRRAFEPFFTTKAVGKGTGLGLSQVYGFARQSGGGVRITSAPHEGSKIRLYLPPAPTEAVGDTASAAPGARAIKDGRRLLLVEDDVGVAAIAVELLGSFGFEVEAVETGLDALTALGRTPFDIMLSDVVMPGGMTGIELARQAAGLYPALRIVLTSGYAGEDVDAALSDAPWPFIRKPYSGEELARVLGRPPAEV